MATSNSDPNGWTWVFGKNKHHQTKPIDNPYVKDVEKIATSFFVTNFPNTLDAKNLWKEFQPFGRIVDAFIANKRSKQGKRFGFVRFLGIHNEEVFAKSLSNVWIGSYHVFVSVAKFQRNPIKPHVSTQQLPKASHDRPTFNTNNLPPKISYASVTHAESQNNLSQQSKLDNIKSVQLNDDDLILVEDSSTVVLIKVSGLPLCAWGSSAFKKIANLFGKFNFFDDDVEDSMCMGRACITTKIQSLISEKVNVTIKDSNFNVHVKEIGTWSTLISNDMDSNDSDDEHDMEEHRSTNEDVDPNEALDDFIQQNIVKESALKDSKEGDQANVSTHVAGDNETLFSRKVKEEYFVTKEDNPSKEDMSDTSKPPGFENFIKENSECSISSNASRLGIDLGGCQTSGTWAKIVGTINHLHSSGIVPLNSIRFKVGDGSSIRFWKDTWLGNDPLYIRYNRLFHLENNKDCFISQRILNGSWEWDWCRPITMGRSKTEFDNLIIDISNMEIDDLVESDTCVWSLSNDDSFSVNSVRKHIDEHSLPSLSPCTRWYKMIPKKVNVFMWRMLLDRLPNRLNLSSHGLDIDSISCMVCNGHVESNDHIFFTCDTAVAIWNLVRSWIGLPLPSFLSCEDWTNWFDSWHVSKDKKSHSLLPPPLATVNIPFASMSPNSNIVTTSLERTKEDDVAKISTSIYVSNFPEVFSAKRPCFMLCKKYGHVFGLLAKEISGWVPEFADEFDDDDESEEGSKGDTTNSHGAFNFDDADDVDKVRLNLMIL
ncbi:RNA-directed DNA polymerase, eukaryota, reverse transcriptase zinc-binding domain protein [Tanacetum coccineum]